LPHILEEKITKCHGLYSGIDRLSASRAHCGFVLLIGAGPRQRHLPQRQSGSLGLGFDQFTPHPVHGNPVKPGVDRGQKAYDFEFL
jgi:hypothetical protein